MPLPAPTDEESAHAARVAAAIRERMVEAGGWLPFADFMDVALYAPGLGYYATPRALFGADGDFVTAPELSPLFAACIAHGIAGLLEKTGGGDVGEFGAGTGSLAAEVSASLASRGAPVSRYRIVEPSLALTARQRERLARSPVTAGQFEWLPEPPREAWQGVAFANEVLDALPVERFRLRGDGCDAIGVVATSGGFSFEPRPATVALAEAVEDLQRKLPSPMPSGFVSELRLRQRGWLAAAARSMTRGAMLIVDYGLPRSQYYHPSRAGGTLCGFRRHRRVEDVLANPGLQDLTAWVDFSALAEDAAARGLEIGGFATQA
ncbi:MAG: class I SAM-dependent methyltransferase, partial [Burkholderiales bacterium]